MSGDDLAAAVTAVLAQAGIQQAPASPAGDGCGRGFSVDQMPPCGRPRVAVRWHPAPPPPAVGEDPELGELASCRAVLAAAGNRIVLLHGRHSLFLAVIPPGEGNDR